MQIAESLGKRRESGSLVKLNNLAGSLLKNMLFLDEMMSCNLGVLINLFFSRTLWEVKYSKWCSFQ